MNRYGWIFLVIWCAGSIWNAWVYQRETNRLRKRIFELEVDKLVSDRLIEFNRLRK